MDCFLEFENCQVCWAGDKPRWEVRVWLVLDGWRHGELATSPVSGLSGVGAWGGVIPPMGFFCLLLFLLVV